MASGRSVDVRSIVYSAVCLALCITLPYLTGGNAELGTKFAPMHFPVLLCGFLSGPVWGGLVGVVAPFLRFLIAGAPAIYPMGIRMAAELCVYGIAAGLFYRYLPKKPLGIYVSLLCAQFFGRLAWGGARFLLSFLDPKYPFQFELIISETVTPALLGIGLQLLVIPPIVIAMQRARFISKH